MQLRVLGQLEVVDHTGSVIALGGRRNTLVLAHLAAAAPGQVSAHQLIEAIWGDNALKSPGSTLRMTVSRLRRALARAGHLGEEAVARTASGYAMAPHVDTDALSLQRAVERARRLVRSDPDVVETLAPALRLWRSTPYDGFDDEVFHAERARLSALRIEAVERLHEALLRVGRATEGLAGLRAVADDHPLHEGLAGLLMRVLYDVGDQVGALRVFDRTERQLRDELGVDPSPSLTEFRLAILQRRVESARPQTTASEPAHFRIGEVVARNLSEPVEIDTVGDGEVGIRELATRAEANARIGYWTDATTEYLQAISLALETHRPSDAAELLLRLANITWDPDLSDRLHALIERCADLVEDPVLAARLHICRAGGGHRTGAESAGNVDKDSLYAALALVEQHAAPVEVAWATTQVRVALSGSIDAIESLMLTEKVRELFVFDPLVLGRNRRARFVELLRADSRAAAGHTLRAMEQLVEPAEPAVNAFGRITARNCWDLAMGRFDAVQIGLGASLSFGGRLSAATLDQVVLGQSYWLTRELGQEPALEAHLEGADALAAQDGSTPLWPVAAAVLATDLGRHDEALALIHRATDGDGPGSVPPGSHRVGILSFMAEVLAGAALRGVAVDRALPADVADALEAEPNAGVLMGWPAVFIGSKDRAVAMARAACGDMDRARVAARRAMFADRHMPPLFARSLEAFALTVDEQSATAARERAGSIRKELRTRLR